MEKHVQNYLPYFLNERSEYSAIGFFKYNNFTHHDKKTAHFALNKCLEHMCSSSDQELKSKASKIKETLKNEKCKKDINAFWVSKNQEEKKQNIEKRIENAEKKSKLCDIKQRATVKKLVYKQDNTVRENFNAEMLEKRDSIQDTEKEQPLPSIPKSRKRKAKNQLENKNFKMRLLEHQLESEVEDGENEECEDGDDVIDFSTVSFDQQAESSKGEGWTSKNGEKVRDVLVRKTSKAIEQAKKLQSEGKNLDASTLSTIRLGLSSIVDLSSEFSGGMCSWFGEEWSDLKAKALAQINIKPKKFEDAIESDINKIEELCSEYKYWEARDLVYEKLKGRPDKTRILRQVMKIYFFILEMFLVDPFIFVDKEGNKQNLTEIEFVLKVAGPIIDIIFSDVQHLVQLKWGETVSKATAVGRKIDLQVTCRGKNQGKIVELSHSECARRTTPTKIISDRSKCLRTNKSVLDKYLLHDLSDEIIKNSAVIGLQLAALYGQIIGVDLLDNGLYFGFEGPLLRFPSQINDITVLKQTLEALYFFKESIVHKAEALSSLNKDSDPFSNIFHTEIISKPHHRKAYFMSPTYFTPQKNKKNEIKFL
ncbi:hypothetical protein Glove_362g76 [Diversispora epigaea]|uniref:Uncharacterized protein n=1 Tax=Diversispora epigaea TaxID=1348612 RepID=A0A397H9C2_9GLOM|nr:hypothetical protein Glove_362g76 [Diversispora epigaea]